MGRPSDGTEKERHVYRSSRLCVYFNIVFECLYLQRHFFVVHTFIRITCYKNYALVTNLITNLAG